MDTGKGNREGRSRANKVPRAGQMLQRRNREELSSSTM